MISPFRVMALALALVLGGQFLLAADQTLLADGDHGKGPSSHKREANRDEGPGGGRFMNVNVNFAVTDRRTVYDYYGEQAHAGHCPPGLAKKQNGCLPPGQAKGWSLGRPLPREVVFYALPADLTKRIHPAPPGYRYVRVGPDVLMIAMGSGLVVAAIEDLAQY